MTDLLTLLLMGLLVMVAMMLVPRRPAARLRRLLRPGGGAPDRRTNNGRSHPVRSWFRAATSWFPRNGADRRDRDAMTLAVQQMAALLTGGRSPARLWEELMLVHSGNTMGAASYAVITSARGAAMLGSPVSAAIRKASAGGQFSPDGREQRVWFDIAACLDVADSSGCPLADVLTRLAAQLEVEDDAEAARQTALAGPQSTVTLLTWLPLTGLGLGMALGVDPLAMLLGTPTGMAVLLAGAALTVAGRVWSARLVRSAAAGLG